MTTEFDNEEIVLMTTSVFGNRFGVIKEINYYPQFKIIAVRAAFFESTKICYLTIRKFVRINKLRQLLQQYLQRKRTTKMIRLGIMMASKVKFID